jgi:hypothetical protein
MLVAGRGHFEGILVGARWGAREDDANEGRGTQGSEYAGHNE